MRYLALGLLASLLALPSFPAADVSRRAQGRTAAYTREQFPDLRGPYLGQKPPAATAERFAPGIVSVAGGPDSVPQFSPDGQEVYWSRVGPGGGILVSRIENGRWTFPQRTSLAIAGEMDFTPMLFARGQKMLLHSTRPLPDGRRPIRGFFTFWIASREGAGWGALAPIDSFYTGHDDFSAIGEDGTLYLGPARGEGTIMRITPRDGRYGKPEPLVPATSGFPALVGPNAGYLIVAKGDPAGGRDLFILFGKGDGTFGAPINMGQAVNSSAAEQFASLSSDGKYFFFCSERGGDFDVYWMDAKFIKELRRD